MVKTSLQRGGDQSGCLPLRVFTGLAMAFGHGVNKISPSQRFLENVGKLGYTVPEICAWVTCCAESFRGLLPAAGLMTDRHRSP